MWDFRYRLAVSFSRAMSVAALGPMFLMDWKSSILASKTARSEPNLSRRALAYGLTSRLGIANVRRSSSTS
jgi:hypothetical protein